MRKSPGTAAGAERSDTARNRTRLLKAERRLVREHGVEKLTM